MNMYPEEVRDVDPQYGVCRMSDGSEVSVASVGFVQADSQGDRLVQFHEFSRPEAAQLAARLSVAAETGHATK